MNKHLMVCGLGSMGRRRIRILQSLCPHMVITGVDTRPDRLKDASDEFGICVQTDYLKSLENINPVAVFVCTSPLSHAKQVLAALKRKIHTFSEINLSQEGYDDIVRTASENNNIAFLSSTTLYKKEMQWIFRQVRKLESKLSYRYHVGQYLPDWHPWESYSDFFVAKKESNACREIMAIELPWMVTAFGAVKNTTVVKSSLSDLPLVYPDTFHVLFEHENGAVGNLTIDCISQKAVRSLEIFSDKMFVRWDGTPDSLEQYCRENKTMEAVCLYNDVEHNDKYEGFIVENPYVEEVEHFFHLIEGNKNLPIIYDYEKDRYVLGLIDEIEHGSKGK